MKKICAIAVPLLLATATDAHCPRGYEVAMHSGTLSCIKAVSSSDSAVEDGRKRRRKNSRRKSSKSKGSKGKSTSKSKAGLESTDTWLKTRSMNTDAVEDGIRIYASQGQAVGSPTDAFTVEVPASLRSERMLSAMGSIVITRCNDGDYDPDGKPKFLGSCYSVCGKGCYKEDELQPLVQTRAVIGNCECPWSKESECEKEEHHCTVVAPPCDCSASDIGGSYEAHLQLAVHSGGKRVKNNYVMQIKPSKDHGFLSVFSPSGASSFTDGSSSLLGPFQGEHDDDKKFVPTWSNVFSMGVPGGNSGKPIAVRGKYTLTLGPWDDYHKQERDTCSPLILTRVLFNKNKMSPETRQSDSSREGIFSTKVSQNCLHPNWDKPGQKRVCTYEFADTGLLDTNDKGYVSVAVNMHKSCILEPGQKRGKGGKATGDYYRITDVDMSATVLD